MNPKRCMQRQGSKLVPCLVCEVPFIATSNVQTCDDCVVPGSPSDLSLSNDSSEANSSVEVKIPKVARPKTMWAVRGRRFRYVLSLQPNQDVEVTDTTSVITTNENLTRNEVQVLHDIEVKADDVEAITTCSLPIEDKNKEKVQKKNCEGKFFKQKSSLRLFLGKLC